MKRLGISLVAMLFVGNATARAERYVLISSLATGGGEFQIGVAPVGSSAIATVMSGSIQQTSNAVLLRDALMPPTGIVGVGKRGSNVLQAAIAGIRVFYPDSIVLWVSPDGSNWTVLSENEAAVVSNFSFRESGTNEATAVGTVPAVGTWGLLVLGLAVVVAGSLLARARYTGLSNR